MQYSTVLDRKVSSIEWVLQTVIKKTLKNCSNKAVLEYYSYKLRVY